jgi:iron complex transport system substrate-binding protein
VPYQERAVSEILKSGARFLGLAPKTLSDIYTDIATIAGAVGSPERGAKVIAAMQLRIEHVRALTAGAPKPRVFCEEWGKPIIASQRWIAELVEAAGGEFLCVPGRQVRAENIEELDPEIIIAAWCGAGDRVPLKKLIATRGWQRTSAAQHDRIFCIRDEFLNTPAPTLLHGLDALAFALHPDLFPRTKGLRQITDVPSSTVSNSLP